MLQIEVGLEFASKIDGWDTIVWEQLLYASKYPCIFESLLSLPSLFFYMGSL
jgi:hypothetical protein